MNCVDNANICMHFFTALSGFDNDIWFGLSNPLELSCTGGVPGAMNSCANADYILWSSQTFFDGGAYWTRTMDFSPNSGRYAALTKTGDVVLSDGSKNCLLYTSDAADE